MHCVFDYSDYVQYLTDRLSSLPQVRGSRAALAKFLGVQSSFVSQVLTRRAHFSREQAIRVTEFLETSHEERRFFMLLVDLERAGSKALESFYRDEIADILRKREEIRDNLKVQSKLDEEAQAIYYSSWVYSAVHILSAIPGMNSVGEISRHLRLPLEQISDVAKTLSAYDLVTIGAKGELAIGAGRIHLGNHSPHLSRTHSNWRIRVLESLERPKPDDLHFSGVYGISKAATKNLRQKLLEFIREAEPIVAAAPEEQATVVLLDLFEL